MKNNVRHYRQVKGYTSEQLAVYAGLSKDTVLTIERGQHSPTLRTLEKLADALGVPVVLLISDKVGVNGNG